MKKLFLSLVVSSSVISVAAAQETTSNRVVSDSPQYKTYTFQSPCLRGPIPRARMINSSRDEFISFLQQRFPSMNRAVAAEISYQLCDDMRLVGKSDGLSALLTAILFERGYYSPVITQ